MAQNVYLLFLFGLLAFLSGLSFGIALHFSHILPYLSN